MTDQRILVLGGGYTGMMCALRLARLTKARIVLVNADEHFTERLRLHQTAAGQQLADLRIPDMLTGTGIEFVRGRVESVDVEARTVLVDADRSLPYDTLVYALGTRPDRESVPGVADHAFALGDRQEATRLAARLAEVERTGGRVAVCGGGLTGVEAAAEIAESRPGLRVTLVSREAPGQMMGPKARAHLMAALARLGVEVRPGAEITKVLPDAVELAGGEVVDSDAVLWTTGTLGLPVATESGLAVDGRGRIVVDDTLRSVSHPDVYAIGDSAAVSQPYGIMHGTCQGGIPTGAHAAAVIARRLRGRPVKPFRFGYFHQPVSLGRRDAVIQFTHGDDTPRRFYLKGRWAVAYKEFVSSSPWKNYRLIKHYAGAIAWPHNNRVRKVR